MIEVDQIRAQELLSSVFGAEYARSATNVEGVAVFLAAHRQQAEDAMRERCVAIVENYASGCHFDEELEAAKVIATAIRSIDTTQAKEGGVMEQKCIKTTTVELTLQDVTDILRGHFNVPYDTHIAVRAELDTNETDLYGMTLVWMQPA